MNKNTPITSDQFNYFFLDTNSSLNTVLMSNNPLAQLVFVMITTQVSGPHSVNESQEKSDVPRTRTRIKNDRRGNGAVNQGSRLPPSPPRRTGAPNWYYRGQGRTTLSWGEIV